MGARKMIAVSCRWCNDVHAIDVNATGYNKWAAGEGPIQHLLADNDIHQREMLISGTCRICFENMFGEE